MSELPEDQEPSKRLSDEQERAWQMFERAMGAPAEPTETKPLNGTVASHLISSAKMKPKPIHWVWRPWLPGGFISVLGGRGGVGKGVLAMSMASAVTQGRAWPVGGSKAPQGRVLWGETEDPIEEVLVPRAIAADADRSKLDFVDPANFIAIWDDLRQFIIEERVRLIVLSPMVSFLKGLGEKLGATNDQMSVRSALEGLGRVVDGTDCALLGLMHVNKGIGLDAIERLLGSVEFVNFVRSVSLASKDPEDRDGPYKRLVHAKYNLSQKANDVLYSTEHVGEDEDDQHIRAVWHDAGENVDEDQLFDRPDAKKSGAHQWLKRWLKKHGEMLKDEVIAAGEEAGFKATTLKQAFVRGREFTYRNTDSFPRQTLWSLAEED